ncbi:MAG: hypothetical protein KAV87_53375 [Desulfobacteraceae bacterium]|nr:hypothetical protein [Desulfobacteraceae bacterium]
MQTEIERVRAVVAGIRDDCETLEKNGELTERGKGQMDVVRLVEEALKD